MRRSLKKPPNKREENNKDDDNSYDNDSNSSNKYNNNVNYNNNKNEPTITRQPVPINDKNNNNENNINNNNNNNNINKNKENDDIPYEERTKCEKCCGVGVFCPDPCAIPFRDENARRELMGHESFNMNTNEEYRLKYGLHSEHMRRKHPEDWIILHANLGAVEPEINLIIQESIEEALLEAMPKRNDNNVLISPSIFVWM